MPALNWRLRDYMPLLLDYNESFLNRVVRFCFESVQTSYRPPTPRFPRFEKGAPCGDTAFRWWDFDFTLNHVALVRRTSN